MIKNSIKNIASMLLLGLVMSGCESDTDNGMAGMLGSVNNNQNQTVVQNIESLQPEELVVGVADYSLSSSAVAASSELMTYRMPAVAGGVTQTKAIVLIPEGQAPADGWPVIAWGHQTTGAADACAPSNTSDMAGAASYLNRFVQNGYAVVATDYEGLGEESGNERHPYLHLNSAGQSMLYAVRAAVSFYPSLSRSFALLGHSQGGHAALGAAALTDEQDDVSLTATVAIAPPSNFRFQFDTLTRQMATGNLEQRSLAASTQVLFSALLSEGIVATQPGFDQSSLYGANGQKLLNALESDCLEGLVTTALGSVVLPLSISGNIDRVMPTTNLEVPEVVFYMASNEPGSDTIPTPVLLVQGVSDSTVFVQSTRRLRDRLQGNGTGVGLSEYANATHATIVDESASEVLEFLNTRFGR